MESKEKNIIGGSGTKIIQKRVPIDNSSIEQTNLPPQKFGKGDVMPYLDDWYDF